MSAAETISVIARSARQEPVRSSSASWMVAKVNPVSRVIGALLLSLPLLMSLDVVSASCALVIELALLWIGGAAPWIVLRRTWFVWIAAITSLVPVLLYGNGWGHVYAQFGWIVISEGSLYLAFATALRVLAVGVPGVFLMLGLDPTDLADGLVQILHLPQRFVYGSLAGMRMFTLLRDDWTALGLSRRSRGLGDGGAVRRMLSQSFGLLVLSIRRASKLATAMEARGFGGQQRSAARVSRLHPVDWLFYAICLAVPLIAMALSVATGYWRPSISGQ